MAITDQIFIMREAIVKLTQMLAGQGIQVTQRGVSAYVEADGKGRPKRVNLPYIPDNASQELLDAIQGFLDHEVAHILETDFTLMGEAKRIGAGGMLNIIEDARIERAMAKRFQGSAENMARMGRFFLDKYTKPKMEEALASGDNNALVGVLMVPLIRAMAGQEVFADFMKDKMHHVEDIYEKIKDLAPKIEAAASTHDALDLAKVVTKRLRDGEPGPASAPAPVPKPKMSAAGGGKGEKDEEGKGKSTGKAAKSSVPKEEKEEDASEEKDEKTSGTEPESEEDEESSSTAGSTSKEESGDEEEDEEDASTAGGKGKGEDGDMITSSDGEEDDEGEDDGGVGGGSAELSPPDPEDEIDTSNTGMSWEAIDRETAKDYDDVTSSLISDDMTSLASAADYLVFSKDNDIIEPLHVGREYKDTMLSALQDKVEHMVGPLQKDLERAIAARSLSQYSAGHRSGRLHAANLSRLAVNDSRVFRRKHEVTSKDVAVELVVDMSGSMNGQKIHTAAQAAYALCSVLERIGIVSEAICFTTGAADIADKATMRVEESKLGRRYSRYEQLYMPILKSFNERMSTDVKRRFGWLPHTASMRNNVDGECVEIAGRRLMARKEKGKILMVLSDGAPSCEGDYRTLGPHLCKVVENLTRTGMNVIGIGIMSDAVKSYYSKSLVLRDVSELPLVVMKELRSLIVH